MAIVLGSLCLLGLGIFGPGIASGIVSGGPQLGAGAAAGTALAAGGVIAAGGAAVATAGGAAVGAVAGAAAGAGRTVSTAASAYRTRAAGKRGMASSAEGVGNVERPAHDGARSPLRGGAGAEPATPANRSGATQPAAEAPRAVERDTGGLSQAPAGDTDEAGGAAIPEPALAAAPSPLAPAAADQAAPGDATPVFDAPRSEAPDWARAMRRKQAIDHGVNVAAHTLRGGDSRGPGASVSVTEKE